VQLLCFLKKFACIHPGGVALVQGACMCAGGALCGFRALVWCFVLFVRACFCLGCVELLPLPKGIKTCLLQAILFFAFPLAFDCLLKFLLVVSFLFVFSLVTKCVCCQCTHQGGD
jgi:hypothetical protein